MLHFEDAFCFEAAASSKISLASNSSKISDDREWKQYLDEKKKNEAEIFNIAKTYLTDQHLQFLRCLG
jgi:hypothetical protein